MRFEKRNPPPARDVTLAHAREMRQHLTPAELKLWSALRGNQFHGHRFRRQHRIGPFIADFYCADLSLVVEVDGDTHADREREDAQRSAYLASRSLSIVRFTNHDVSSNLDGVLVELERSWATAGKPS